MSHYYLLSSDFAKVDKQLPGTRHDREGVLGIFKKQLPALIAFHEKGAKKSKIVALLILILAISMAFAFHLIAVSGKQRDGEEIAQHQERTVEDQSLAREGEKNMTMVGGILRQTSSALQITFFCMCTLGLGVFLLQAWHQSGLSDDYSRLLTEIQDLPREMRESDELFEAFLVSGLITTEGKAS